MIFMDLIKLQNLLAITERMLVSALDGEWDELDRLEREQSVFAREMFVGIDDCSPEERALGSKIAAILAQVINLAEQHKVAIAEQLIQLKKSSTIENAYLKNSG